MKKYRIYPDGSCRGTEKRQGGWAVVICDAYDNIITESFGGCTGTTNQRMEVKAVIEGLRWLKEPSEVIVFSDSLYVVNTVNDNWLQRILNEEDTFSNVDLWQEMAQLLQLHKVTMQWVKGHADNKHNNRADYLAQFVSRALNLPEDEHPNNSKESRKPLVSEPETRRSDGFDIGQKDGEVLYSLG